MAAAAVVVVLLRVVRVPGSFRCGMIRHHQQHHRIFVWMEGSR
jgi:hypothetical protein